ncbi:MAG: hypothetical protein H6510_15745 [Acidobacteria bacterium]|nr:hypothetical protein [Acidobacteriota bacterium]MCB9399265.1 hypothetical protein [Acidobacteriota bacterium]
MAFIEMIAIIAVVSILAGVVNTYLKSKQVHGTSTNLKSLEERLARLEAEMDHRFEARIANLETIVTSQGYALDQKLRDLS